MDAEIGAVHLRVARPTNDLQAVLRFYREGLGLEVVGQFTGHDGFDGVMLGRAGGPFHLEFTMHSGCQAPKAPTPENLLVFYVPDATHWRKAVARMEYLGYKATTSFNPYWDQRGKTFEDPDGYRVVLENADWTK